MVLIQMHFTLIYSGNSAPGWEGSIVLQSAGDKKLSVPISLINTYNAPKTETFDVILHSEPLQFEKMYPINTFKTMIFPAFQPATTRETC